MIEAIKPNGLNVKEIAPRRGNKFSPNLYKWLTDSRRPYRAIESRVYKESDGRLWIGRLDEESGAMIGERLFAVLCQGRSAISKFWMGVGKLTEIENFWPEYLLKGRCAIDPKHEMHFVGDKTRWQQDGDSRVCLWCGQRQTLARWTETVERQEWRDTTR